MILFIFPDSRLITELKIHEFLHIALQSRWYCRTILLLEEVLACVAAEPIRQDISVLCI